jgi:hypothetical protein
MQAALLSASPLLASLARRIMPKHIAHALVRERRSWGAGARKPQGSRSPTFKHPQLIFSYSLRDRSEKSRNLSYSQESNARQEQCNSLFMGRI